MDKASELASEITIFSKYAKYIPELKRRETWAEIVDRYFKMMEKKYAAHMHDETFVTKMNEASWAVLSKKVLPSMRALQFAGVAADRNNSRIYNCGYAAIKYTRAFADLMFLLLGGTGVGFSVRTRDISQLPVIKSPKKERKFLIGDSIEGWADAVNALMKAYFEGKALPRFDFSDIRPKGHRLVTSGGKAPGPGPLRVCLSKIQALLEGKHTGSSLSSVDVADICCYIADAVRAGGIRRAALIALFDIDDSAMLAYKKGDWYVSHPERARVNVSAVGYRKDIYWPKYGVWEPEASVGILFPEVAKQSLLKLWDTCEASGSGEPGVTLSNSPEYGTNPCAEIALKHKQFCNLTEINFTTVESQEDLEHRAKIAAFLGTLQAGFTDFHYLDDGWRVNCEEEALLGVSMTGIADNDYKKFDFTSAGRKAKETNEKIANLIGINPAARITCLKPAGTTSLVFGSASGVHARHSECYIRRFRFKKNEEIAKYLSSKVPDLVVQDLSDPDGVILELPQKAPEGSILRSESAIDLLERVKYFYDNWVLPGHVKGANTHNVSCTVSVGPDEWEAVKKWMIENKDHYTGIALLPRSDHTYQQAPFEDCTKEYYEWMMTKVHDIDLSEIVENDDETELTEQVACSGGSCELV